MMNGCGFSSPNQENNRTNKIKLFFSVSINLADENQEQLIWRLLELRYYHFELV
jgi:hypothetical protein